MYPHLCFVGHFFFRLTCFHSSLPSTDELSLRKRQLFLKWQVFPREEKAGRRGRRRGRGGGRGGGGGYYELSQVRCFQRPLGRKDVARPFSSADIGDIYGLVWPAGRNSFQTKREAKRPQCVVGVLHTMRGGRRAKGKKKLYQKYKVTPVKPGFFYSFLLLPQQDS